MAQLSMGETKWRMLRLAIKKKRFRYEHVRNWSRKDEEQLRWLMDRGFVEDLGDGWYAVTTEGREAADLGFYEG